jgi:hypothetical protein
MQNKPTTVAQLLATLPKDRRDALQAVRKVIRANVDSGYAEGLQYGMIGCFVPHRVYPAGYHCDPAQPLPYIGLASQKNHMALYLFCVYTSEQEQRWFCEAWAKTGKKLDMGKSCVRFRKLEDLPLDVIGRLVKRTPAKKFIAHYEAAIDRTGRSADRKKRTGKKAAREKKVVRSSWREFPWLRRGKVLLLDHGLIFPSRSPTRP